MPSISGNLTPHFTSPDKRKGTRVLPVLNLTPFSASVVQAFSLSSNLSNTKVELGAFGFGVISSTFGRIPI